MITQYDRDLANAWTMEFPASGGNITFQFPPRMVGDSREAAWREGKLRDKEPIAVFESTGPRVMNIEWTDIVGEVGWNATRVSSQVQLLKSYFLNINRQGSPGLVAKFQFVLHGQSKMSGRIHTASIDYSTAYVGQGQDAFPLRSTIKIDCRVWTKGQPQRVNNRLLLGTAPTEWA
jgi:hypothetical protein